MPCKQLFHLSEYAHQIQIQHCMFHSLPIILGVLVLVSTHEGVKAMYFLHQHYARSCIWCVSVENCLADAFFGRSTHTLDLPSLVEKKHVGYWNTLQYVPSGGGVYLARIFHFGELPFLTNSTVCQHSSTGHSRGHISHN